MTDSAALMTTPDYGGGNDEYKEEADEDFENFREGLLHKLPEPLLIDLDALEEKPWEKEGADINDYFNYGLDEHTFKLYQGKVRDNFSKLDREEFLKILKEKKLDLNHDQINFYLPHEAGGCGITKNEEYEVVNTYRIDTDDPPILCNKSYGYYAKITKNGMQKALEMQVEGGEEAMIDSNAYSHGRNDVNSIDGLPVRQGMINPRDLDHPKGKVYLNNLNPPYR
ncbi:unnamed protein product [Moneuplotes crassus]|uniref:Pre-mRNA polyadenylation factor Fip1 domain-containing protein n=1 Tax=Euplotes crassus TaxID=5936 RepID=A0AAD1UKE1_EUPCR|nr:unnamed protein product [Moneuplotes crassus]